MFWNEKFSCLPESLLTIILNGLPGKEKLLLLNRRGQTGLGNLPKNINVL
jgi:hypothetical protein